MTARSRMLLVVGFAAAMATGCDGPEPFDPASIACENPANDPSASHPRGAQFQALLDQLRAQGLPGAVLAVKDKDGTWFGASGYAHLETKTLMKPCHSTRVMSLSKIFTAATVLKLVEQQKMSLDEPIAPWLPSGLATQLGHSDRITARQLLSHTSGLQDGPDADPFESVNDPYAHFSAEKCVAALSNFSPEQHEPGTVHRYCNHGYDLFGLHIVPNVAGASFGQVLTDNIVSPLGLGSTTFGDAINQKDPRAVPSYRDVLGDGVFVRTDDFVGDGFIKCRASSAGVVSNAYDLMTFADALFRKKTVLSQQSLEEMLPPRKNENPSQLPVYPYYGLGLYLSEFAQGPAIMHDGSAGYANRNFLLYLPERDAIVVFWFNSNTPPNMATDLDGQMTWGFLERVVDGVFGASP